MTHILDYLFGPLDNEYCLYFYGLSILAYISFLIIVIGAGVLVVQGKLDYKLAVTMLFTALVYFVSYFQSRLLYSMCSRKEGITFSSGSNYRKKRMM